MSAKKPKDIYDSPPVSVRCLRCDRKFKSPDKRRIRLCPVCRQRK